MTPPPIRYPLPTLVALIGLLLLGRYAETVTRPVRAALATRWKRVIEGPPVPSSSEPRVAAGPIVRRVLILKENIAATEKPDGAVSETIGRRMFADVYDTWPLAGPPAFFRIGNRHPFGWVPASVVLAWDTRLVVRPPRANVNLAEGQPSGLKADSANVGAISLPVVAWDKNRIRVAVWDPDRPWERVSRLGWVVEADFARDAWGVFLSRDELVALLRLLMTSGSAEPRDSLRLRAILGRLGSGAPFSKREIDAARGALPAEAFRRSETAPKEILEGLARINESWSAEAAWSNFVFQFVPLAALP